MIMDYPIANTSAYAEHTMDLLSPERHEIKRWDAAKIGAFVCFVVAGGILIASLLLPTSPRVGHQGLAANLSEPVR
jgi:hypothetical protein